MSTVVLKCTARGEALDGIVLRLLQIVTSQRRSVQGSPGRLICAVSCHHRQRLSRRQALSTGKEAPAVTAIIYMALLLIYSSALCIFGFFVGRCARKIPILDENLPRALHRGEMPKGGGKCCDSFPS
jgi:hypothetical protein